MSNVQTAIEDAQDALDIAIKDLAVERSEHSAEVLALEKGSAKSTSSRRSRKSANVGSTKEALCKTIMESLRALKAHGIEAIELNSRDFEEPEISVKTSLFLFFVH